MDTSLVGKPMKRFLRLLMLDRKEIGYIYVYAIFNGLIYLSIPLGIQAIISQVLANQLSSSWVLLIVVVTLGTLVVGGLQIMQMSITEMLQERIFTRSAFEFAYRLPRIKFESLAQYYPPELVNRFFDTLNIQKGLPKILIDLSTATLQVFFGLILLSFYHPFFVFFGFTLIGLLYLIFWFTGPRGLKTSLKESDYKYQVAFWLEEVARTLSTFKLSGVSAFALKKVDELVIKYLKARKAHFRVLITQFGHVVAFKTLITAGLLIIGSVLLIQRELNVGQFVASEIVILIVISSVEKLILSMETIYDVLTAVEKIGKVTDMPLERPKGIPFSEVNRYDGIALSLNKVHFQFPGSERTSLFDINLHIEAGEKICLAGPPGSGKTILLNVLSGLYDTYTGTIAYNDIPIRNLDLISTRSFIGDCLSEHVLFRGTVEENLRMGREEVSFEDMMWALQRLGLMPFIHSLPEGLNTLLVPEGPQFPQSIVKKLIMARCVAKRPQLLVMEDFLAVWDAQQKERICEFLTCNDINTLVAVGNERTLAQKCDKVVILREGKIYAVGTYDEVIKDPFVEELFK